jgi:hypothetical protein
MALPVAQLTPFRTILWNSGVLKLWPSCPSKSTIIQARSTVSMNVNTKWQERLPLPEPPIRTVICWRQQRSLGLLQEDPLALIRKSGSTSLVARKNAFAMSGGIFYSGALLRMVILTFLTTFHPTTWDFGKLMRR